MKKRISMLLPLLSIGLFAAPLCQAQTAPELTRYLDTQIGLIDDAVARASSTEPFMAAPEDPADQMLYFNAFLLRLRGTFGVEVPGLAKFEIVPETELVWQRTAPEGWIPYKP